MTMSPIAWGAGLACALGGAVAGNALGSTPILDRPTIASFYQSHEDRALARLGERETPPDHYPLVTQDGTVPVGELATRGLYSQTRYRAFAYQGDPAPVEFAAARYPAASSVEPHEGVVEAVQQPQVEEASVPLQLASGPAVLESGNAKRIDVKAVLAMR